MKTVAATGQGIEEFVEALDKHRGWLEEHGKLAERRTYRASVEIESIALAELRARIGDLRGDKRLSALAERVVGRDLDPYAAADELVDSVSSGGA